MLFRSPLRRTTALEAYRDRDPNQLLDLSLEQGNARPWELLLSNTSDFGPGETVLAVR